MSESGAALDAFVIPGLGDSCELEGGIAVLAPSSPIGSAGVVGDDASDDDLAELEIRVVIPDTSTWSEVVDPELRRARCLEEFWKANPRSNGLPWSQAAVGGEGQQITKSEPATSSHDVQPPGPSGSGGRARRRRKK